MDSPSSLLIAAISTALNLADQHESYAVGALIAQALDLASQSEANENGMCGVH